MRPDEARGSLWSDLVNGLLDARTDPATARFDAELAAAVAAGELSRRTAQRLRFWQRAAVNAADDHARTVVPAVLGALETARTEAQTYVEQGRATLEAADRAAPTTPMGARDSARRDVDDVLVPAATSTPDLLADETFRLAPPDRPRPAPGGPPTAAQQATAPSPAPSPREDVRRASAAAADGPSTLEEPTPRVFVADLRDVPARTDRT